MIPNIKNGHNKNNSQRASVPPANLLIKRESYSTDEDISGFKDHEISRLRRHLAQAALLIYRSEQLWKRLNRILESMDEELNNGSNVSKLRQLARNYSDLTKNGSLKMDVNGDQEFIRRLKLNFPALSSNDLRICSLLRLNFSTKEVAIKLGISPESANKARYRIRKKLNLSKGQDLVHFILRF